MKAIAWLLGPTWAFGQETAVHALRLMGSGLFDRPSRTQASSSAIWAKGCPTACGASIIATAGSRRRRSYKAKKKICEYFNEHFFLTTSGNFRTQTLIDSLLEVGADRLLFSVDWPFENVDHASRWFDSASISETDRKKIGRRQRASTCSSST